MINAAFSRQIRTLGAGSSGGRPNMAEIPDWTNCLGRRSSLAEVTRRAQYGLIRHRRAVASRRTGAAQDLARA